MCSDINEKSSLKTIRHCSPHLQLWFSGSEIAVCATWPIDLQLLKYFRTSKKFLRTSGFLQATCPGQVAEKKIWSPLPWHQKGNLSRAGLEIYTRLFVFMCSLSVRTSENCYWLGMSDEWVFHSENCLIMPFRERVFQNYQNTTNKCWIWSKMHEFGMFPAWCFQNWKQRL